jgi:hypothetical protein
MTLPAQNFLISARGSFSARVSVSKIIDARGRRRRKPARVEAEGLFGSAGLGESDPTQEASRSAHPPYPALNRPPRMASATLMEMKLPRQCRWHRTKT